METDQLERSFLSIRRALKFCSLVLVVFALLNALHVVLSFQPIITLWREMMPALTDHWTFDLSDYVANRFYFIAALCVLVVVVCMIITARSRGGLFLYLNLGIFLLLSVFNAVLLSFARSASMAPLQQLTWG